MNKLNKNNLYSSFSPCFTGDTPVMIKGGFKRIDEIKIGDFVYSHTGELRKVVNISDNGLQNITRIKMDNADIIETTENHKFYIIHNEKLDWVKCKDIKLNSYVCVLKKGSNASLPKEPIPDELLFLDNIEELSKLYAFRKVLFVKNCDYQDKVYDIETDIDHSFCVTSGVIVLGG